MNITQITYLHRIDSQIHNVIYMDTFLLVCIQYNDNACTAQLGLTVADLEKEPVVCIAFYDNSGALVSTKIQKIKTLADKYTISCPQGSASCKVMLWTQNLAPVCEEAVCEY